MRARWLRVLARFALAYLLLVWLAGQTPLYAWLETLHVALVECSLAPLGGAGERELRVARADAGWVYRYQLELDDGGRSSEQAIHPHGFVTLVWLALAAADRGGGWRRRLAQALLGAAASSLLAAGMLASDVQGWEVRARGEGPYPAGIELLDGLHATAAGALIPLVVWFFLRGAQALGRPSLGSSART